MDQGTIMSVNNRQVSVVLRIKKYVVANVMRPKEHKRWLCGVYAILLQQYLPCKSVLV